MVAVSFCCNPTNSFLRSILPGPGDTPCTPSQKIFRRGGALPPAWVSWGLPPPHPYPRPTPFPGKGSHPSGDNMRNPADEPSHSSLIPHSRAGAWEVHPPPPRMHRGKGALIKHRGDPPTAGRPGQCDGHLAGDPREKKGSAMHLQTGQAKGAVPPH